jgi:hypothetical protein
MLRSPQDRTGQTGRSGRIPRFDLQAHSSYSDGELPPAQVVAEAARAGIELLALTDHDTVAGQAEAAAAAGAHPLELVTGVEVSVLDPDAADLHICGYLIDPRAPALLAALASSREARALRTERMCDALQRAGWRLDRASIQAHASGGASVGRPHLAQAVFSEPANASRLAREGLHSATDFLTAYLVEGKPAYSPRLAPSVAEAIELLHQAGGIAVWAHPFWDLATAASVSSALRRFTRMGLDGVEAFYATHSREQTQLLVSQAATLGLLTTGSSDFHGPSHPLFHSFGAFPSYELEARLGPILD